MVGGLILFVVLNEAPGLFVRLPIFIFEIDTLALFPDRYNVFWSINPTYCKPFTGDGVIAEKVLPKVCGILDDFSVGFVLV